MIEQVSVFLENKSGRLAELTRTLGDAGINMHALMVADTSEFGVARVICDAPERAKALLDEAGFGASIAKVLAVEVPDRPGGLADLLETLDAQGLNVEYAYCFVEPVRRRGDRCLPRRRSACGGSALYGGVSSAHARRAVLA